MRRRTLLQMVSDGRADVVGDVILTSDSAGYIKFPADMFSDNEYCMYICVSDESDLIVMFNLRKSGNWDCTEVKAGDYFSNYINYDKTSTFDRDFNSLLYSETMRFYIYKIQKES